MLRLLTAAFAATLLLALPAVAGNLASLTTLGYSEDGRYFAFEESGEYDLIEGYYDRIFIIDTSDDSWVQGTPFVTDADQDGEDQLSLVEVHNKTMDAAAPLLKELKIGIPANIDMLLPDALIKNDGKLMDVKFPSCCAGPQGYDPSLAYKLMLKTFAAKSEDESCDESVTKGFALTDVEGDGTTFVVHKDGSTLPQTRGCAQDYKLYGVFSPAGDATGPTVAIVSYYFYEDEGLSRLFIAVPLSKWTPPEQ